MGSQFSTSEFTAKVNECMKGFNTVWQWDGIC
jgi:hypothetical protein